MNPLTNFPHKQELETLAKSLLKKGDEARIIGGAARDFLAGKKVNDIDIACQYLPEETIKILNQNHIKTFPTGIKHGTITAVINHKNFEITTLRIDRKTFGRHAEVEFTDDYLLDAKRRDFTINAISIDFNGQIHDYFGGQNDLKNQIVRFIGDAKARIEEDYLRILRFFRFSCYYAKELDQEGLKACIELKENITSLSKERIKNEITKILSCDNHDNLLKTLDQMNKSGILNIIFDAPNIKLENLENLLNFEKELDYPANYLLRFAALLYNHQDDWKKIMNNLRFSNHEKRLLENNLNINLNLENSNLDEMLFSDSKEKIIDDLILSIIAHKIKPSDLEKFSKLKNYLQSRNLPEFMLDGNDLLKLGIKPKKIGQTLEDARRFWIESSYQLQKQDLIELIKKLAIDN